MRKSWGEGEVVQLCWTVWGSSLKKMLMSVIRDMIADTGVQPVTIVVVKIRDCTGLRIGQVRKNRPLAAFELLGFEAGPAALGLGVVVAVALPALRAPGSVLVQEGTVSVAAVLTAPVGVYHEPGRGRLRQKGPLQGRGDEFFGHRGGYVPAHHVLAGHVLKGAQIGPGAVGKRQIRDVRHPHPRGLFCLFFSGNGGHQQRAIGEFTKLIYPARFLNFDS